MEFIKDFLFNKNSVMSTEFKELSLLALDDFINYPQKTGNEKEKIDKSRRGC